MKNKHCFGWHPDLPDFRDYYYEPKLTLAVLPTSKSLLNGLAPPYQQGSLGSCTSQAIAGALKYNAKQQKEDASYFPSRLSIYYYERLIENSVSEDSGAEIRDGIKVVVKKGAPNEKLWPYTISKFTKKPSAAADADGLKHKAISYKRLNQDLTTLKSCLANNEVFVFGFSVYESFESDAVAATGKVPMPQTSEQLLGGHAVLCYNYNDKTKTFGCRNSWGMWGDKGNFYMPYDYLLNSDLASDFWVISSIM